VVQFLLFGNNDTAVAAWSCTSYKVPSSVIAVIYYCVLYASL